MHFDLDSLALFSRAAELGNLAAAAEASHIAPSAASRRIALLEHHFKARLFERHWRGLKLTPAGERLLENARLILDQVHRTEAELAHYASGQAAVLRICASTSALAQHLPADMASFQRHQPDVRLVVQEKWSELGAQEVRTGKAHLAVVLQGPWLEGMQATPYRTDNLAAILPRHHALARRRLALQDLLAEDLVCLENSSSLMTLLSDKAAEIGLPLRIRAEVKSFEAVCRMVQAGLGIGMLPHHAAKEFEVSMGLKVVKLSDAWGLRRMFLCARPGELEPALQRLIAHLAQSARDADG